MFNIISTSKIIGFADGNVLSLCPTMELLVLSMNKMSLWMFRLNGERIYSINNKSVIIDHCWSPDGKCFGLTGIDKTCKIYDTNDGSLIEQFSFDDEIRSIDWNKEQSQKIDELFEVDLIDNLPSIEEFTNFKSLEYMVLTIPGQWGLIINNLVRMKLVFPGNAITPIKSFSFGLYHQVFVVKSEQHNMVQLVHARVQKNEEVTRILKILCKLQLIFKNVSKDLDTMEAEIAPFLTLFDRYLSNYADNNQGQDSPVDSDTNVNNITKSFNKILVSNLIPNYSVDYWLNQFGERGRKRLSKLGNGVYDTIRDVAFKKIINYMEKIVILLSELKSSVQYSQISDDNSLGIPINVVSALTSDIQTFFQKMYQLIWDCNEEQQLFNEYLTWAKYLIDILTREKNDDELNIPVTYSYVKLMEYFHQGLFCSRMFKYFNVEMKDTDVIHKQQPEFDSIQQLGDLKNQFNSIFEGFQGYFSSIVQYSDPVSLDSVESVSITKYKGNGLAHTVEDSKLKLIEFGPSEGQINRVEVAFDDVVNYKIANEEMLVLSKMNGCFYLSKYLLSNLLKGDLEPSKRTTVTNNEPNYLLLNDQRSYGCLLDKNKKDYTVFEV